MLQRLSGTAYFEGHIAWRTSSRSMSSLVDQLASKLRSAIHMHQNVLAVEFHRSVER